MKRIIIILFIGLSLCGCNSETKSKTIINGEYMKKIAVDKEYVIVDVRTKEEYNELHIVDSINIPVSDINNDIDLDKSKIIFVYCRSGNRSKTAYEILTNLGFTVYDLGGISDINLDKE